MNIEHTMDSSLIEADATLVTLVDKLLEGQLNEGEKAQLEERIHTDDTAQKYTADRLRLHSELYEFAQPLRVELLQKQHIVFERKKGIPRFVARESKVARISNSSSGRMIELPPNLLDVAAYQRRVLIIGTLSVIVITLLISLFFWQRTDQPQTESSVASILTLRNASFEQTDLSEDKDGYSYTLLDWQDHFLTENAGICDLEKYSTGAKKAYSGKNVAVLNKYGFLTQRLMRSDGIPLILKPGQKIRISGWACLKNEGQQVPINFALRVVRGVKPEMLQYEPCSAKLIVKKADWHQFQMDFTIPEKDLTLFPSDTELKDADKLSLNVAGKELTLSIHNRLYPTVFLDDLSIEIVSEKKDATP